MDFPDHGLIPKQETQAADFLIDHPAYDGRGILIAILDTGVDPGAPGLSVTTDGQPKFLDFLDATGSGDVDISSVRKMDPETREIEGLSGRLLKIPTEWNCPSGEFHVGIKIINQLLPSPLRERCDKEWKSKVWNKAVASYASISQKALDNARAKHNKAFANGLTNGPLDDAEAKRNKELMQMNEEIEDLTCQLDVLKDVAKWKYPGLVCDCLVWQTDGGKWRAVIDTSEGRNLTCLKVMGSYRETFQYDTFSSLDMCNYTLDIYPEKDLLVIVCNSGSHATHVASIAAGNGSEPSQIGVAPGAQLISIKIGDSRLDSMETGIALLRAIDVCIERGVDLINYSYGESAVCGNVGPLTDAINEAVTSHGITFVSSAGNEGPALSTVGAPGGTCTNVIGVGAYVLPSMMKAAYAFHRDLPAEQAFTWSSRGPTYDGWPGPAVCAPGGAIASVPNWTLSNVQLKSGTSMSSPNACGCCALIMSGLKAEKIDWSPFMIRRALTETARPLPHADLWAVGAGLVQVNDAFEYCKATKQLSRFSLNVSIDHGRGVLIRSIDSLGMVEESFNVTIRPVFIQGSTVPTIEGQQSLIQFRLPLKLTSDVPWLTHPEHLHLTNAARTIMIKVNDEAAKLKENCAYFGRVLLTSPLGDRNVTVGSIPVTLIKPVQVDDSCVYKLGTIQLRAGELSRHFLKLNNTCCRATILLRNLQEKGIHCPSLFIVHTNYHAVDRPFKQGSVNKSVRLYPGQCADIAFTVDPRQILEVCIGKYWNSMSSGTCLLSAEIVWSPIACDNAQLTLFSSSIATRLTLSLSRDVNEMRDVDNGQVFGLPKIPGLANNGEIQMSIEWRSWSLPLNPSDSQICHAFTLSNGKQLFRRLLTYNFSVASKCDVNVQIPILQEQLYDCPLLSQMWMIFDSNKQLMLVGDSLGKYSAKLNKGDYIVRLQLIHEKLEFLDNYKDLCVNIVHKLQGNSVPAPDLYRSTRNAVQFKARSNKVQLSYGRVEPVYIGRISDDKHPKGSSVGCVISGVFSVSAPDSSNKLPLSTINYVIVNKSTSKKSADKNSTLSTPLTDQYLSSIRDLKIQWIPKLTDEKIVESIINEYSDQLSAKIAQLQRFQLTKAPPSDIIQLSDSIINSIDEAGMSKTLFSKKTAPTARSDAEKLRLYTIEALLAKGRAILESKQEGWLALSKQIHETITSWIDYDDPKVSSWSLEYFVAAKLYGKALSMIFSEKSNLPEKRATEIFRQLGWDAIADGHYKVMLTKQPPSFILF